MAAVMVGSSIMAKAPKWETDRQSIYQTRCPPAPLRSSEDVDDRGTAFTLHHATIMILEHWNSNLSQRPQAWPALPSWGYLAGSTKTGLDHLSNA